MKIVVLSRGIVGRKWDFVREDDIVGHPADHERKLNDGLLSDEAIMARPVRKVVYRVEKAKGWWAGKNRGTRYVAR